MTGKSWMRQADDRTKWGASWGEDLCSGLRYADNETDK